MQENKDTNDTPDSSNNTGNTTPVVTESTPAPIDVVVTEASANTDTATSPNMESPAVVAAEATATATTYEAPVVSKKQVVIQYGIAALVVLIMCGGLLYALEQQGRVQTGVFDKVSSLVNPVPAAAVVNGTKISKADYDKNLTQLQAAATAQGADATDEAIQSQIKQQAIDVLVNTELLRQEAYKEGADVTAEQIDARYKEILDSVGGEEQLAAKMTELGITEPALRKDIEGEILIQGHLSKAVDTTKITISEKELSDAYAQISSTAAAGVTIPPLAEIKTQLESQLKVNKEQELVNEYITKLREAASIEVLI